MIGKEFESRKAITCKAMTRNAVGATREFDTTSVQCCMCEHVSDIKLSKKSDSCVNCNCNNNNGL